MLRTITPDFETLEQLSDEVSQVLMRQAIEKYGAKKTYLFSIFNSVVFPKNLYEKLRKLAEEETAQEVVIKQEQEQHSSVEAMRSRYEREIAAMNDRFEKKMSGMQKKYLQDVQVLKKQISALQKKLTAPEEDKA